MHGMLASSDKIRHPTHLMLHLYVRHLFPVPVIMNRSFDSRFGSIAVQRMKTSVSGLLITTALLVFIACLACNSNEDISVMTSVSASSWLLSSAPQCELNTGSSLAFFFVCNIHCQNARQLRCLVLSSMFT